MNNTVNHTDKQSSKAAWQIGFKLFIICAAAALSLGIINQFTNTAIKERLLLEKQNALKNLANGSAIGEGRMTNDKVVLGYYPVQNNGQITAYILELSGTGYGGTMKILAMYEPTGKILKAQLLEHNETPGLGDRAKDPAYMQKFIGTGGTEPVPVTKEMLAKRNRTARQTYQRPLFNSFTEWLFGKQDALTGGGLTDSVSGATITFKGVSQALAFGAIYVRNIRGNS